MTMKPLPENAGVDLGVLIYQGNRDALLKYLDDKEVNGEVFLRFLLKVCADLIREEDKTEGDFYGFQVVSPDGTQQPTPLFAQMLACTLNGDRETLDALIDATPSAEAAMQTVADLTGLCHSLMHRVVAGK